MNINEWTAKECGVDLGEYYQESGMWECGDVAISGEWDIKDPRCREIVRERFCITTTRAWVENKHPEVRQDRQLHGTTRALVANMVTGVSKGFEKKVEIYGTGYSVKEQGGKLILQVGFSHPVERVISEGIKVKIDVGATKGNEVPARFTLSGIDKCLLGQFAADIRKINPPEPYKGKGIRYADEHIRRKVGKAFTSGAV